MNTVRKLCFTLLASWSSLAYSVTITPDVDTRIFFRDTCPVTNQTAAMNEIDPLTVTLLAKVGSALIGGAIDAVVTAMTEEKVSTFIANERVSGWYVKEDAGFKISPSLVCVVGVVANRAVPTKDAAKVKASMDSFVAAASGDGVSKDRALALNAMSLKAAQLAELGITEPPLLYFEFVFAKVDGLDVFAMQPVFFYYPNFIGPKAFWGSANRDFLVQIDLTLPGESTPFASQRLQFSNLSPGSLTSDRIKGLRQPWMKMPATDAAKTSAAKAAVPFNAKLLITETSEPGTIAKLLAGVVQSEKSDIQTAAENKIKFAVSESDRQAARSTAAESANQALTAYFTAYDAYTAAYKADADAKSTGDAAAKAKAASQLSYAKAKLQNAEDLAASSMGAAGIDFTRLPLLP